MVSKVLVALSIMLAVATAVPAGPTAAGWPPVGGIGGWGGPGGWGAGAGWGSPGGVNPWIPPWVVAAARIPAWAPCTTIGAACLDCNIKVICTKVGGIEKPCSDPALPYCNLGQCSATPTAECAVPVPVSAGTA